MPSLPVGKLRATTLQALLDKRPVKDPRVVVGPKVGEDAAVIDLGDRYLVATTDPITFATDDIARYALQVNANDVAVRGARPRWFLATLLLPEGRTTDDSVERLFVDLHAACDELDVALVGGHTEVAHGLDRVVIAGTMLGEVAKDKLVTTGGARALRGLRPGSARHDRLGGAPAHARPRGRRHRHPRPRARVHRQPLHRAGRIARAGRRPRPGEPPGAAAGVRPGRDREALRR